MRLKLLLPAFLCCVSIGLIAQTRNSESPESVQIQQKLAKNALSYKIINIANNTFGYDIYNNDRLMIHQPSIPGFPGNEGFKTKASAEKTAQLVISKINKGEMPPTVSMEDLKLLKAIP
jgi:hypothetical protein